MIKLVSTYSNITDVKSLSVKTIDQILTIIKNGNLQLMAQITAIRNMTSHGEQNIAKKELPVFTCNGTFHRRNNASLLQYSSFIAIDFDGFSTIDELLAYKEHLKTYSFVYAVFVSPSGNGLKAIIQHTSTNPAHHYNLFVQLHRVFGMNNANFDGVVSDISRGTYFSYDPDLWINPCCRAFEFVYDLGIGDKQQKVVKGGKTGTTTASYHYETSDADRLMNSIFQGTMTDKQVINFMNNHFWKKQKEDYEEGNRQSSLLRKASQLCKYGVLYENALEELKYRYCYAGLEEEEVEGKVAYCYSSNVFGSNRKEILEMSEDSRWRACQANSNTVPETVPLR
ncbi:BT4734/BF3469 family protein [Phocaeicola vulgatus]